MMHPAFARKRLEAAILSAGVANNAADAADFMAPDCLAGLAILLGNRARGGMSNGDVPAALRDLLAAEGVTLPGRAEGALRFAEARMLLGDAPLPRTRLVHRADKVRENGDVSAVCFDTPRAIDMRHATWTTDPTAVTCRDCMEARK